jgi:putative MATE family efflux protein
MDEPAADLPRFVTGSTLRHVVVMTATGSVGLIAIFVVDLLSLLYISWLGVPELTAAVGLSTIILFMTMSINVGLMIAVGALVSRAIGAGERERARRLAASCCVHTAWVGTVVGLAMIPLLPWLLPLVGASGEVLPVAERFLWIVLPSNLLIALGMSLSSLLRAVGDAKRAMYVTLAGAVVTAAIDPILIFGFGLGTDGAALTMVISRLVFVYMGYRGAVRVHDLVGRPSAREVVADGRPMFAIAVPAILTNVATPIANAFFAGIIARYGAEAIAGAAIVDRIVPVAFGGLFALSGSVGPILAQNWGARRFDRMRQGLRDALLFMTLYVVAVWIALVFLRGPLVALFRAEGLTAELVDFFCLISGFMWFFIGLMFVANASFNNLGFPLLSTGFNWARATLGTVPFALIGAAWAGPTGALAGLAFGATAFGVAAVITAFWTVRRLERNALASNGGAGR